MANVVAYFCVEEAEIYRLHHVGRPNLKTRFFALLRMTREKLCGNLLAEWVENGEFPNDEAKLAEIVTGVSYVNVKEYLGF